MNFDLSKIVRPSIQKVNAYSSARDEFNGGDTSHIFLDANENPEGSIGSSTDYNRYPDPYQKAVKTKLAELKGVRTEQIFLGNGSDESIDLIYRIFCQPGQDNVITLPPTYGMYGVSAAINDVQVKKVTLTKAYQLDTKAILAAVDTNTKVIWVCSPNNPTGDIINKEDIIALLRGFNGIVAVDEAYIDFCPEHSIVSELDNYPNLIVTQTFSKAWGLANLRIGIAFASKEIIDIFNKIKPPYNINGYSQKKALQALDNNDEKLRVVREINDNRTQLAASLAEISIIEHVHPSASNMLLAKVTNADDVYNTLVQKRIIVRNRSKVVLCDGCLRFTVGTASENRTLIRTLETIANEK